MKKLANNYENPQVTRSKQILTEAFFELLKEKPYQKIGITKLCNKAGIARPTFYSHFDTIEEIPLAHFDQWLNKLKIWIKQLAQEKPSPILNPSNNFSYELGEFILGYWCNEVELVKNLQNNGFENVILKCFIMAHEIVMKELHRITHDLPSFFQIFLQRKAGIVTYELYKYWINTDRQLSIEQLSEIYSYLNSGKEIIEIQRISVSKDKK